jgi:hypothetical protein
MADLVIVNGRKVYIKAGRSNFTKTAFQLSQVIYDSFNQIGITKEFIDLPLPRNPMKEGEPAQISWKVNGKDFYYLSNKQRRYVDNLGVISVVIKQESYAIRNGLKTFAQVMNQFAIGYDEDKPKTKTPREVIGVASDCKDFDYIEYKFKQKAKELHPDINKGDGNAFRELNEAFVEIKKEFNK